MSPRDLGALLSALQPNETPAPDSDPAVNPASTKHVHPSHSVGPARSTEGPPLAVAPSKDNYVSIPQHVQGSALKKLEDAWHQLHTRPYPRKSSDPGVAALYDELRQVDEAMSERLRTLIAGQPVSRLDFEPPVDFLDRLKSAANANTSSAQEARAYVDYVTDLFQVLRLARLLAR